MLPRFLGGVTHSSLLPQSNILFILFTPIPSSPPLPFMFHYFLLSHLIPSAIPQPSLRPQVRLPIILATDWVITCSWRPPKARVGRGPSWPLKCFSLAQRLVNSSFIITCMGPELGRCTSISGQRMECREIRRYFQEATIFVVFV